MQDLDDWDGVGVNTPRPPNLLHLFRDYGKHVFKPIEEDKKEIDRLAQQICNLVSTSDQIYLYFPDQSSAFPLNETHAI